MLEFESPQESLGRREWCEVLVQLEEQRVVEILLAVIEAVYQLPRDGRPYRTDDAIEGITRTTRQWLENPSPAHARAVFDNLGEIVFGSQLSELAQYYVGFFEEGVERKSNVDSIEGFIKEAQRSVTPLRPDWNGGDAWQEVMRNLEEHLPRCLRSPCFDK